MTYHKVAEGKVTLSVRGKMLVPHAQRGMQFLLLY